MKKIISATEKVIGATVLLIPGTPNTFGWFWRYTKSVSNINSPGMAPITKKKIIQLEKANAKVAKELLQTERELKIESSLEKVCIMASGPFRK